VIQRRTLCTRGYSGVKKGKEPLATYLSFGDPHHGNRRSGKREMNNFNFVNGKETENLHPRKPKRKLVS
jgi:hypothetical protein